MSVSMLREWAQQLGLREQGVLLVSLRGCDLAPKFPLDSPERRLTAALRYAICVPFDEREVDAEVGCFMLSRPPMDVKLSMFEHYPLHYVMHMVHACQVLGYRHPEEDQRVMWLELYMRFVKSLHLRPESFRMMLDRLGEDRIEKGTVVSV